MLNKSEVAFDKNEAFDVLIDLKVAAATEQHKDLPHFQAVFLAMKQKMSATNFQFRKYLSALLRDKHQEKVLDILAKVDKGFKLDGEIEVRFTSSGRRPLNTARAGTSSRRNIRCFYCGNLGHAQAKCFRRQRDFSLTLTLKATQRRSTRLALGFLRILQCSLHWT